jgi:hypothetical protein
MLNEETAKLAASAVCYQCRTSGPPVYGAKGGGQSIIQVPKTTWWHHYGDLTLECKAKEIWDLLHGGLDRE